ncbi:MAG: cation-transporting P-type ATPase [Methanomicrobiales archaeon]|nr:cation-transporting P-type ATPase [Methanomicrobiales archaeon]
MAGDTGTTQPDNQSTPDFSATVKDIFLKYHTGPSGLSSDEAEIRISKYGKNTLQKTRKKSVYVRFIANFTHLMAILLWIGGFVAFFANMPQLGVAVWMVNLINGAFSFWQEFRAEKAADALMQLLPPKVRIIREGETREIAAEFLVPGDLLVLAEGDHVSADGRLIEASQLRIDQSTLTGESHPVKKISDPFYDIGLSKIEFPNLIFAGTSVVSGTGLAVVTTTGMATEFGKVANLTQGIEEEKSPLQQEMVHVTRMVTIVAVSVGILFFLILITMTTVTIAESFIFALGMIVAFVPEGLLPTVTLALARGSQRMAKRNALIKRLSAVETLGCTSVICTDKTGTLTQNEMTVQKIWIPGAFFSVSGVGYSLEGEIHPARNERNTGDEQTLKQFFIAGSLCSNARLISNEENSLQRTVLGDPTEAAILVAAAKYGISYEEENHNYPRVKEFPFDSRRKRMSTVHYTDNSYVVYLKGAPKVVLDLSKEYLQGSQVIQLSEEKRSEIMRVNDSLAEQGLRILAIAMRNLSSDSSFDEPDDVEHDITFLGLIAMMDPPRAEVATAVQKCHHAHIRIIMITGDYGLTAKSIARRIGIVTGDNPRIVTGSDLDRMADGELKKILEDEVIFARVAPEHKLLVVKTLRESGHIVAVTGDGVNDAPALKKADIGVAMGITGTDVAKEAADIVLTDDNFASIVNAVEEGRAVYANIKKFTGYIFTSNTPEAVPFILFAFSKGRIPLALDVMPILSIDLGTDLVPALSLGSEPPEEGVMDKPPRNLKEHVITRSLLLKSYLWLGPIQSLAVMSAFFYAYWTSGYWGQIFDLPAQGPVYHSAVGMALAAVVTTQIGNVLAHRTERSSIFSAGFFTNKMVWVGIVSEIIIIIVLIYVPFFQEIIGTAPFPLENWIFLFAWAPALLLAEELRKGIMRMLDKKKSLKMQTGGIS